MARDSDCYAYFALAGSFLDPGSITLRVGVMAKYGLSVDFDV